MSTGSPPASRACAGSRRCRGGSRRSRACRRPPRRPRDQCRCHSALPGSASMMWSRRRWPRPSPRYMSSSGWTRRRHCQRRRPARRPGPRAPPSRMPAARARSAAGGDRAPERVRPAGSGTERPGVASHPVVDLDDRASGARRCQSRTADALLVEARCKAEHRALARWRRRSSAPRRGARRRLRPPRRSRCRRRVRERRARRRLDLDHLAVGAPRATRAVPAGRSSRTISSLRRSARSSEGTPTRRHAPSHSADAAERHTRSEPPLRDDEDEHVGTVAITEAAKNGPQAVGVRADELRRARSGACGATAS